MAKHSVGRINALVPKIAEALKTNPVAAAELCQKALTAAEKGFREELYEILATVYELANVFRSDAAVWQSFCQAEFWKKCKQKKPTSDTHHDEIMLWVSRFVFRASETEGTRYNRAYKHARTLQRYSRDDVSGAEVAERLANEGADYVFRMEVEEHPKRSKVQPRDDDSDAGPDAESDGASAQPASKNRSDRASEKLKVPILQVEMTEERLQQVLDLEVGERAKLIVKRTESDKSWKRIVGTSVKVLDA